MKRIIFIAFILLSFSSYAVEFSTSESSPQSNLEKLEAAREQMEDIRKIFKLMPQKIVDTTASLKSFEESGKMIEETINKHLSVLKACEAGLLTGSAAVHCKRYDRTNFGVVLKGSKDKIMNLLKEAKSKLAALEKEKENFPILDTIKESLKAQIVILEKTI